MKRRNCCIIEAPNGRQRSTNEKLASYFLLGFYERYLAERASAEIKAGQNLEMRMHIKGDGQNGAVGSLDAPYC